MSNPKELHDKSSSRGYALRGDVVLGAFVILFFLLFLTCCWACINPGDTPRRRRRRLLRLMSSRQIQRVFYVDPTTPNSVTVTRGLDASVLKSLPVFTYSSKTHPDSSLDCAVCLSEFEENESGRVLPNCNHSFHVDCIDMWFHSHSTCPTCRSTVERPGRTRPEIILAEVVLSMTASGSSSVLCQHEEEFVDESTRCDPPMSRMLSFTRNVSIDRRDNLCPPSVNPASRGGSVSESDIEPSKDEAKQTQG